MKKFQVDVDGHVFALVTKDAAMCIFRKDRQQEVYLIDGNGDSRRAESRREVRGYKYVIRDEAGNREMRLRKDGGIEIDFITPVF